MGGPGAIAYLPEAKSLVVTQPADVQQQVQRLLEALLKAKAGQKHLPPGKQR
jgi:hypothetical protein